MLQSPADLFKHGLREIMLFFLDEKIITQKLLDFHRGQHSELLDITRSMVTENGRTFWTSMDKIDEKTQTINLIEISNTTTQPLQIQLQHLHTIAPVCLFKHIGSVEANRAKIKKTIGFLDSHYQGRLLNPAHTIIYGLEKKYLLSLQEASFPTIPTALHDTTLCYTDLIQSTNDPEHTIIKPLTGELSNSFSLISEIDEAWLRRKESLVGGWLVQPVCDAVWNGEFQIVFLGDNISHAMHKQYAHNTAPIPDQRQRTIKPYSPSENEIALGKELKTFFKTTLDIPLDYFRLDFLKDNKQLYILEVEMVNPGFFYRYLPNKIQHHILTQLTHFLQNTTVTS